MVTADRASDGSAPPVDDQSSGPVLDPGMISADRTVVNDSSAVPAPTRARPGRQRPAHLIASTPAVAAPSAGEPAHRIVARKPSFGGLLQRIKETLDPNRSTSATIDAPPSGTVTTDAPTPEAAPTGAPAADPPSSPPTTPTATIPTTTPTAFVAPPPPAASPSVRSRRPVPSPQPAPTRVVPVVPEVPAAPSGQPGLLRAPIRPPRYVDVGDPFGPAFDDDHHDDHHDGRHVDQVPTAATVQRTIRSTATVGRRRPRIRRVTRVIRHVDPWSVFKVALCFSVVLYGICLTAGVLLWNVAYTTGTIDNMERFFESFGWDTFEFKGGELYHNAWIGGLFAAVGLTGLIVLVVTLFNLITDLVGGVRVTVLEEEVIERDPLARRSVFRGSASPGRAMGEPYDPDAPIVDDDGADHTMVPPSGFEAAAPMRIESTRELPNPG